MTHLRLAIEEESHTRSLKILCSRMHAACTRGLELMSFSGISNY
jgi:hypothetical protein